MVDSETIPRPISQGNHTRGTVNRTPEGGETEPLGDRLGRLVSEYLARLTINYQSVLHYSYQSVLNYSYQNLSKYKLLISATLFLAKSQAKSKSYSIS